MAKKGRIYGQWAGNPHGRHEVLTRCITEIWPQGGYIPYQCRRKRGHGPDFLYCKQHAKILEDKDNG